MYAFKWHSNVEREGQHIMDEKNMQFANFNITFGQYNAPMLEYFETIIYPAFTCGRIVGKCDTLPRYFFENVQIKEIDEEYVMVGNYVKETEYKVVTTVHEGELVSTPSNVPTAPYSRFLIFLRNHRMVLVRNETASPNIRNFQKTVREMLSAYIRTENKNREKGSKLPKAIVHIVDIPLKDNVTGVLQNVTKVNWFKLRFFPLNNDLDPLPLARYIREDMQTLGSKTTNIVFNTPTSKNGITQIISETGGLAVPSLLVTDADGEQRRITAESFTSTTKIEYNGNISPEGDIYIASQAKKDNIITNTSPDNTSIYERMKEVIRRIIS